jgi:hypothetical protein
MLESSKKKKNKKKIKKNKIKRGQVAHIILAHSWLILFWPIVGPISLFFWHLRYSLKPMPYLAHWWLTSFWPIVGPIFLLLSLCWPFVGPLFVFGLCGIVSNPGSFQPIVGFHIWPIVSLLFVICGIILNLCHFSP